MCGLHTDSAQTLSYCYSGICAILATCQFMWSLCGVHTSPRGLVQNTWGRVKTSYHPRWLKSITVVLHKIGKSFYNLAKSYCPIGLIDTILKVLSTLCSKHTLYLAEKHNTLPAAIGSFFQVSWPKMSQWQYQF